MDDPGGTVRYLPAGTIQRVRHSLLASWTLMGLGRYSPTHHHPVSDSCAAPLACCSRKVVVPLFGRSALSVIGSVSSPRVLASRAIQARASTARVPPG